MPPLCSEHKLLTRSLCMLSSVNLKPVFKQIVFPSAPPQKIYLEQLCEGTETLAA